MMTLDLSTIAQLLYPGERSVDFARIVAELETVLSRLRGNAVAITWDCDDLVFFDMPETRILLAWSELDANNLQGCLTVSVGPGPKSALRTIDSEHDVLCSRLVERIQNRFIPIAVIWRQVEGTIGSDLIDDLIDSLPDMSPPMAPVDGPRDGAFRADARGGSQNRRNFVRQPRPTAKPAAKPAPVQARAAETAPRADLWPEAQADGDVRLAQPFVQAAPRTATAAAVRPKVRSAMPKPAPAPEMAVSNDLPDLPEAKAVELTRVRTALYPSAKAEAAALAQQPYSTQMRLAAHCFNATLILVYAPLGAAVMTYSLIKGEDMRLSSRLMAVAGTLFALAHSPIGASVVAMAVGA